MKPLSFQADRNPLSLTAEAVGHDMQKYAHERKFLSCLLRRLRADVAAGVLSVVEAFEGVEQQARLQVEAGLEPATYRPALPQRQCRSFLFKHRGTQRLLPSCASKLQTPNSLDRDS